MGMEVSAVKSRLYRLLADEKRSEETALNGP
jgi:hypothetical protein